MRRPLFQAPAMSADPHSFPKRGEVTNMVQFRGSLSKAFAAALTLVLLLGVASAVQADAPIYRQILRSTGWVVAKQGRKQYSSGTCWVVDIRRKLAITNQHVVGKSRHVRV